jgi:long-chain acyl-CoA synthetase
MDRVSRALAGKEILVTGATGFLGQPLLEKILWSAPDVERIHVLIRPKRPFGGEVQTPAERLRRELFQSSVFDRLRYRYGDDFERFLEQKLVAVGGDISQDRLGIDPALREELHHRIDLIINSAAVVSFDAPLDDALSLNTRGAGRVADFAAECDAAALIHVSTAYVCGASDQSIPETIHHAAPHSEERFPIRGFRDPDDDLARIEETVARVREQGNGPEVRRELVEALVQRRRRRGGSREPRREAIENLRDRWIENRLVEEGMKLARERGWNDTYTYTKALGEQIVLRRRGTVPLAIVRPAIIESSLSEPSPGWLDGLRMADPLIAAIGKGRLRSLPLDPDVVLDLVPADMVVNTILAAIPKLAEDGRGSLEIYQVATGSRNPITMGRLHELIVGYFEANPMLDKQGQPIRVKPLTFPSPESFRRRYRLKAVPLSAAESTLERMAGWGVMADRAQKQRRKLAATRAALDKLFYYGELYEPYLNLDCRFEVDNTMRLFEWLTPEERRRFNFDVSRINWRHYIHVHIAGIKKYILKVERAGTLEVEEDVSAEREAVRTINDLLRHGAERYPEQVALQVQRDGGWVRYTFADLLDAALRVGDRFHRLGYAKGDRVVLWSENQPEWGVAYMGAAAIGLVVVPLDSRTWHREVWSVAGFTGARAILASRGCFARLTGEELARNESAARPVALLDVDSECEPFARAEYPRSTDPAPAAIRTQEMESPGPDDLASIIFTTGTAVDPKGAMHTHRNFLSNLFGVSRSLPLTSDDRFLSVLPLYHALEFTCGFLAPLYRGCTVTYARSLKPKVILETMRETGTTIMLGVPTLYALLRDDIERRVLGASRSQLRSNLMETGKRFARSWERRFDRSIGRQMFLRVHQALGGRLRFLVSGGSALGDELYETYRAMGIQIYEGYGLTETAPVLTVNPLYQSRKGSCGKPVPGVELRLFHTDKDGIGEIIVRTPSLMKGYWDNPRATERVVIDGWFHTGDLGWVDADGYLYITGRIKDVIVTGAGKNVYPMDLEAIYRAIPEIEEIVVVGVPSGLSEDVHGVVEPSKGLEGTAEEIRKRIQREIQRVGRDLPGYHRLQQLHVWPAGLPRDGDGKIDRDAVRRAVREQAAGEAAARPPGEAAARAPGRDGDRRQAVVEEIARLARVPAADVRPENRLADDLGLDSLQAIELLLYLDHTLGVSLDDETAGRIETVGQLLAEVPAETPPAAPRRARPTTTVRSALPHHERPAIDRALSGSFRAGLKALYRGYFDLEVRGAERIPAEPPYILAANHSSHLDAPAVLAAIELARGPDAARRLHMLGARDYFFDTPLKRWFFSTFLNVVPIERTETSLAGLRMVKRILSSGESALIFPEGTRSRTGEIDVFKPGLGLLARELEVPIVPVHIGGTFPALPAGKIVPRPGKVVVAFGEPVTMDAYRGDGAPSRDEVYRRIAADVRETIVDLGRAGNGRGRSPE